MAAIEKSKLRSHRGRILDGEMRAAYDRLMHDVLGIEAAPDNGDGDGKAGPWTSFALFEPGGKCVANVDAAILPLVLDGIETKASGIRSVAVSPTSRGQGLFRDLMLEALAWCEAHSAGPTFLYTEDSGLYERFGFQGVLQHAFLGAPPALIPLVARACHLDLRHQADRALVRERVTGRGPASSQCALGIDAALFLTNAAKDDALVIACATDPDLLILYELNDDEIVIADIVAPSMPDLATVLGVIGVAPAHVKILFPPDRLDWRGEAVAEDTGLMMRGVMPPAMSRPFMFPPTAEF